MCVCVCGGGGVKQQTCKTKQQSLTYQTREFKYYLKHEQECFIRYISDRERTTSVLNYGLTTDLSYESIGEVVFKINVM